MKYLLLAVVVVIALWLLMRPRRRDDRSADSPTKAPGREPQAMIACAHCGVHLPRDEALVDAASRRYCCEGHRALGPR